MCSWEYNVSSVLESVGSQFLVPGLLIVRGAQRLKIQVGVSLVQACAARVHGGGPGLHLSASLRWNLMTRGDTVRVHRSPYQGSITLQDRLFLYLRAEACRTGMLIPKAECAPGVRRASHRETRLPKEGSSSDKAFSLRAPDTQPCEVSVQDHLR